MILAAELAQQRGAVSDCERAVLRAAAELIASRNAIAREPFAVVAYNAAQIRVALVLAAHDLLKQAKQVQP